MPRPQKLCYTKLNFWLVLKKVYCPKHGHRCAIKVLGIVLNCRQVIGYAIILCLSGLNIYCYGQHVCIKYFQYPTHIGQMVRSGECCDQNGDRVSLYDKSCYICCMRLCTRWKILDSVYKYFSDLWWSCNFSKN